MILHGTLSSSLLSPHSLFFSFFPIMKLGDVVYIQFANVEMLKFKLDT